jgi:hypothetical protein
MLIGCRRQCFSLLCRSNGRLPTTTRSVAHKRSETFWVLAARPCRTQFLFGRLWLARRCCVCTMSSIFLFASFKRAKAIQSRRPPPLSLLTRWRVRTKHDFHFTANLHGGGGGERYIFSLEKDARQRPSPEREK